MDPERWKQVDDLLQSALRLPSGERSAFLRDACGGDVGLEQDVKSLLVSQREIGEFLERPAIEIAAESSAAGERAELTAFAAVAGQSIGQVRLREDCVPAKLLQFLYECQVCGLGGDNLERRT